MSWKGNVKNVVPNSLQEDFNRSTQIINDQRANHIRRDVDKQKNFTVTIKDIDETVFNHLQHLNLSVVDNGNIIHIPITYASPEKWKSVRTDGFMRDNNGKIILPALVFYRVTTESDKSMLLFNKYLTYSVLKKYSQKNQYTKFSSLTGIVTPVNDVYNVVIPDHMSFGYKVIVWTEYIEQMNSIIERINFETNDYWGTFSGFKFRTYVDSYTHTTEVQSDADRLVKTEFDLNLRGYLLPETYSPGLDGDKSTTFKSFTAKKVTITAESVQTNWLPTNQQRETDKWRSQTYPNLISGTEPDNPHINYRETNTKSST